MQQCQGEELMRTYRSLTGVILVGLFLLPVAESLAVPVGCVGGAGETQGALKSAQLDKAQLDKAFEAAAAEFGVPAEILKAVAAVETNCVQVGPTCDYGYGIMHLVDNDYCQTLQEAADLLGVSAQDLKADAVANIRGAAALIAKYAKESVGTPKNLADYFEALKKISGLIDDQLRESQALQYCKVLGIDVSDKVQPRAKIQSTDYGPAIWNAADSSNYDSRYGTSIDRWINHWIGVGTYAGAISWFKNPSSNVSAHFVVRSSDGELTQMVRFYNRAWHCGYWNARSIGIEHEATTSNPQWWNDMDMLEVSADACAYVCDTYDFPKTRSYIVGHKEVPYAQTSCPGCLPWATYMALVGADLEESIIIDDGDADFSKSASGWSYSSGAGAAAYNGDYYWASTVSGAGSYWSKWTPDIENAGSFKVYVMYRQGSNRANDAPYTVYYDGGSETIDVNQTINGGTWVLLGTYDFDTGTSGYVRLVNGPAQTSKVVIADAAKFVLEEASGATNTPTNTPTTPPTNTPTNTPTSGAAPVERIIDDEDEGYTKSGTWSHSTGAGDAAYNGDYDWASTTSSETKWAKWTPDLTAAGDYEVYIMYREGSNRANDAPYTVYYNGGSQTIDVDQTDNGGTWVLLGTYSFASGTSGYVKLGNGPAQLSKVVIADAVKFTPD